MPVTRGQAAGKSQPNESAAKAPPKSRKGKGAAKKNAKVDASPDAVTGEKREAEQREKMDEEAKEEPPAKKPKTSTEEAKEGRSKERATGKNGAKEHSYQTGTIERGHIYFFYRPRVELEEAESVDDIQRFYMLLVPRPPEFAVSGSRSSSGAASNEEEDHDMSVLEPGADAVPASEPKGQPKKDFRLLVVGKKSLPDPEVGGKGGGRHQVFWATITTVGEDLKKLQEGLGEKTYETKTQGTRHQAPARLAARGAYAIVNKEARVPSERETHIGFHLSHPTEENFGEVQEALGLHTASSFVLQVKNPSAPPTGPGRVGLPKSRTVDYPDYLMEGVFGKGGSRGRESFGLRFASVERKELLDFEGVELLFIAARAGDEGLETSLGEGRGTALKDTEQTEGQESIQEVLKELAMDMEKIPANPLQGEWA